MLIQTCLRLSAIPLRQPNSFVKNTRLINSCYLTLRNIRTSTTQPSPAKKTTEESLKRQRGDSSLSDNADR